MSADTWGGGYGMFIVSQTMYGPEGPVTTLLGSLPLANQFQNGAGAGVGAGGGSTRIENKVQAKKELSRAVTDTAEECFKKIGISKERVLEKAGDVQFFDGRLSEDGTARISDILGPDLAYHPGATFNSAVGYGFAAILRYQSSQSHSNNVVLGGNFFSAEAADQLVYLTHEMFHYATNKDDLQLGRLAGYRGRSNSEASAEFGKWLKGGCK